jgi:hypothetical protein
MRVISQILTCLILASCVAKKEVSKSDIKKDSITIENNNVRIDTIFKERIIHNTEFFTNEITIPCDSAKFNQSFDLGKIKYKIIKEKGSVKVVFKRDSAHFKQTNEYKYIYRQNDSLKRLVSIHNKIEKKEVVKKPFFSGLWKILFFILLPLWILGITPKFIITKFI